MCVKVNLVPGSHFWMLATGAHGIGHKGSNLDFHGNYQNSGKPVIVDMTTNTAYAPLGEKWGVPTISMIPLSEELKAEVAGILTGRSRTKKGILTLLGQGLGPERMVQPEAAGALTEAEMWEKIETFAKIATSCENETRAVLNQTGGKEGFDIRGRRPEWFCHWGPGRARGCCSNLADLEVPKLLRWILTGQYVIFETTEKIFV